LLAINKQTIPTACNYGKTTIYDFFNDLWNTPEPKGEQDKKGEVGEVNLLITS
jgi:hypothetical protein